MMKRLFIAIKVPPGPNLLMFLSTLQKQLHPYPIKWVEPHQLHLTLKFLGETPDSKIPDLVSALHTATRTLPPYFFELQHLGAFSNKGFIKVVWIGLVDNTGLLLNTWQNIQHHLAQAGHPPDKKNFIPHLTLGRVKKPIRQEILKNLLESSPKTTLQTVEVGSIGLYQSTLTTKGPIYTLIQDFPLL